MDVSLNTVKDTTERCRGHGRAHSLAVKRMAPLSLKQHHFHGACVCSRDRQLVMRVGDVALSRKAFTMQSTVRSKLGMSRVCGSMRAEERSSPAPCI